MKNRLLVSFLIIVIVFTLLGLGFCNHAWASSGSTGGEGKFPEKPITLIVPFSPGGGTDIGTRIVARYAEKYLGQPIVIKNVEGGGSEVGVTQMVNSSPDGYTICGFNSASIILTTMRKANYHPINDIEPICLVVSDPRLFAVRADDTRFPDAESFIQYAKEHPKKLTIGTSGAGTSGHLSILALNRAAGIETQPVHFGGAGESRAAFLGKHVDAVAQTYGEVFGLLNEGLAKVVAVATEERLTELPDVPTFKEIGVDLVISSNRGFAAPKGTPKDRINIIAEAFKKACEEPEYLSEMAKQGLPVKYLGPEDFGKLIQYEYDIYTVLAKDLLQQQ